MGPKIRIKRHFCKDFGSIPKCDFSCQESPGTDQDQGIWVSIQLKMRLEQHLILSIFIGFTKSLKITRFDLLQYQYQKPFNQNQSLTVEKYLKKLQDFRHDLNFVEQAIDTVYESQENNQTSLDIGKFWKIKSLQNWITHGI